MQKNYFTVQNVITMRRYTLVGLSPFTEYSVRISATNKLGEGSKSEPILRKDTFKTKEDGEFLTFIMINSLNMSFLFKF